jgi:CheY-like chemotaxis protein
MNTLAKMTNDPANASTATRPTANAKPLVLVVEDHDDTRFMLKYLMELRGCLVVEAADGEEAVRLAEMTHPSLILMDTSLPRLDGLQATRRIRELAMLHNVPVVFISGHAQPNFRAVALATGGNDYLVKPVRLSELEKTVERHLGKNGDTQAG